MGGGGGIRVSTTVILVSCGTTTGITNSTGFAGVSLLCFLISISGEMLSSAKLIKVFLLPLNDLVFLVLSG